MFHPFDGLVFDCVSSRLLFFLVTGAGITAVTILSTTTFAVNQGGRLWWFVAALKSIISELF